MGHHQESELPYTIRTIMQQLGTGIHGALCYCGARSYSYSHPQKGRTWECRPRHESRVEGNTVIQDVGISVAVNGKKRDNWLMWVSYEADDTYTVRLTNKNGLLDERKDVYCDELQSVFERMYDNAINKYNGGFIAL